MLNGWILLSVIWGHCPGNTGGQLELQNHGLQQKISQPNAVISLDYVVLVYCRYKLKFILLEACAPEQ